MTISRHPPHPILIVDDEPHALNSAKVALLTMGLNNVITAVNGCEALDILKRQPVEIVLLDLLLPQISGEEILERIKTDLGDLPTIMVTGVDDLEAAVRCMRHGAYDYLVKPFDRHRLEASVLKALEVSALRREYAQLKDSLLSRRLKNPEAFMELRTSDPGLIAVFKYCEAVASSRQPVLICGETGVGKELIAGAIHQLSCRSGRFVAVNVAGLDDQLFADTLFGHRKGAFTGALQSRPGLIEQAAAGTLFLDEIGDLNETSQVKLLRLLQEREYYPLGSDLSKPTDARIIVATNRDLTVMIKSGAFRSDLYYRLRTHLVRVPPLRERPGDLPLLLDYFLEEAATEFGKKRPTYPIQLPVLLKNYPFPGNIRELKAMVYDAVGRHRSGILSLEAFQEAIRGQSESKMDNVSVDGSSWAANLLRLPTLKEAGNTLIDEAMRRTGNNQHLAAQMLGLSHQALSKRLKRN
ncbi:MAG: sigma-54-dependent Fis family transcriptional regulator [Deltaproteobacteria bacterium]|nr:sigma-54-dependent Fis family transcriptional regulator [Deltaproteobacteria bacterium]